MARGQWGNWQFHQHCPSEPITPVDSRHVRSPYPTNIATAAFQRASGGQPPHAGQLNLIHWVAQRWAARWTCRELLEADHLSAYSIVLWPASVPTDFPLHWFWPPTADLKPSLCLLQWHRVGFQLSTTGWILEAGLLCSAPPSPPNVHQRPAGGLLYIKMFVGYELAETISSMDVLKV